jgi:hypothetical protein
MSAVDGLFTVNDVVVQALKKSGVMGLGQSPYPSGADILDAQADLSDMLAQWNAETWMIWNKLDIGFVSDGRAGPGLGGAYTVGPGGNYNITPRTDRIEAAYVRILANTAIAGSGMPVDKWLTEIPSHEQYAGVALKQLVAFPRAYFYDSSATVGGGQGGVDQRTPTSLGNLYVYPWPQANLYETHIIVKNVFPLTLPLSLDLSGLPPPYRACMKFNLAVRLRQAYGKGLKPDVGLEKLARSSLALIRQSQVQVPELRMPAMVVGRGAKYNIYGDNLYTFIPAALALTGFIWHILHAGGLLA